MADNPSFLFFYGSLKRDFATQDQLAIRHALRFVSEESTQGILYDMGPYPALVHGKGTVYGELFEILEPQALSILDEYEGYDPTTPETSLYVRELASFGERLAWVYIFQGEVLLEERLFKGIWPKENS